MSKNEEDFIENLNLARDITSKFAIAEKIIRTSAKGRKYLDITLADKTGQIDGRMFPDNVDVTHDSIKLGTICRISGRISEFPSGSGRYNMVINVINELSKDDYYINDFVMASESNQDELVEEIRFTIKEM